MPEEPEPKARNPTHLPFLYRPTINPLFHLSHCLPLFCLLQNRGEREREGGDERGSSDLCLRALLPHSIIKLELSGLAPSLPLLWNSWLRTPIRCAWIRLGTFAMFAGLLAYLLGLLIDLFVLQSWFWSGVLWVSPPGSVFLHLLASD